MVSKPENEVAEAARGWDGLGQEETRLGDRAIERRVGKRRWRRRLQQAFRSKLGRRENHTTPKETQTEPRADNARRGHRQLVNKPAEEPCWLSSAESQNNCVFSLSCEMCVCFREEKGCKIMHCRRNWTHHSFQVDLYVKQQRELYWIEIILLWIFMCKVCFCIVNIGSFSVLDYVLFASPHRNKRITFLF